MANSRKCLVFIFKSFNLLALYIEYILISEHYGQTQNSNTTLIQEMHRFSSKEFVFINLKCICEKTVK